MLIGLFQVLSFISCTARHNGSDALFPIVEGGNYGFIDSTGKVVIKPLFRAVGSFSEGLAAARVNGKYGYIDRSGKFVIAPIYDFGMEFSEGLAVVYTDGRPSYIDRSGARPFETRFANLGSFTDGRANVVSANGCVGLIDRAGRLIVDTLYETISLFSDGRAIVTGSGYARPRGDKKPEIGVIDLNGKWIVPTGIYGTIQEYRNGFAVAERLDSNGMRDFGGHPDLIDRSGTPVPRPSSGRFHPFYSRADAPESIDAGDSARYEEIHQFNGNRAFAEMKDGSYRIIDTNGKIVSRINAEYVHDVGFRNGLAFIRQGHQWGAVDAAGVVVIEPQFDDIDPNGMRDGYFFFSTSTGPEGERRWGVASRDGTVLIPPRFSYFKGIGFKHGVLSVWEDNLEGYVNFKGEYIWREHLKSDKSLAELNIDYLNRGQYYVAGAKAGHDMSMVDETDLPGPKPIHESMGFQGDILSVLVEPDASTTYAGYYKGIVAYVANNTDDTAVIDVQDNRLYLVIQALDGKGEWRDIEYLPSSWCGNSYYNLRLPSRSYWRVSIPEFHGEFRTRLRMRFSYMDRNHSGEGITDSDEFEESHTPRQRITVYSNEFEGSINPAQFWRKREYHPAGLMDPYND